MKLEISQREILPGIILITLAGRLMLGPEGAEFESVVKTLFEGGTRNIIIDLGGLTHIDSTGIGRCIAGLNKAMALKAKLYMAGGKGQVRDSFRVTRLDRMFKFFETVDEAEKAISI